MGEGHLYLLGAYELVVCHCEDLNGFQRTVEESEKHRFGRMETRTPFNLNWLMNLAQNHIENDRIEKSTQIGKLARADSS